MENIIVKVNCPYCKKSFMDENTQIDGLPSIRVQIYKEDQSGYLYLSSIYGSYSIISDFYIPRQDMVFLFCPECHASLLQTEQCNKCLAPLAFFELQRGGKVQICSRRGCRYHSLDYSNITQKITTLYGVHEVFADPSKNK